MGWFGTCGGCSCVTGGTICGFACSAFGDCYNITDYNDALLSIGSLPTELLCPSTDPVWNGQSLVRGAPPDDCLWSFQSLAKRVAGYQGIRATLVPLEGPPCSGLLTLWLWDCVDLGWLLLWEGQKTPITSANLAGVYDRISGASQGPSSWTVAACPP